MIHFRNNFGTSIQGSMGLVVLNWVDSYIDWESYLRLEAHPWAWYLGPPGL